jgi:hypothetical protein
MEEEKADKDEVYDVPRLCGVSHQERVRKLELQRSIQTNSSSHDDEWARERQSNNSGNTKNKNTLDYSRVFLFVLNKKLSPIKVRVRFRTRIVGSI